MFKFNFSIIIITCSILIISCSGVPKCVTDKHKGQTIRWGEFISKTGSYHGYELRTDAKIYPLSSVNGEIVTSNEKLFKISEEKYCELTSQLQKCFLKSQALNVPGDSLVFIQYTNPFNDLILRAVWNPKFTNKGNEEFRKLYDSLQAVLVK